MSEVTEQKEETLVSVEQPAEQAIEATHKPEDIAAVFFQRNYNKLRQMVEKLSQRQLRRLIIQVSAYPFTPAPYEPRSQEEKHAAYIVSEMLNQKMVMQLAFEHRKVQEAQEKENQSEPTEQPLTTGENNG